MSIWDQAAEEMQTSSKGSVWDDAQTLMAASREPELVSRAQEHLRDIEAFNAPLGQRLQRYELLYPRDPQQFPEYEQTRDDILDLARQLEMSPEDVEANYPEIKEQQKVYPTLEPGKPEFFARRMLRGFAEQLAGGVVTSAAIDPTQEPVTRRDEEIRYTVRRMLDGFKGAGHLMTEWLVGRRTLGLADAVVDPAVVKASNIKLQRDIEAQGYTVTDVGSQGDPAWRLTDADGNTTFVRPNAIGDPVAINSVAELYDRIVGLEVPDEKKQMGEIVKTVGSFVGAYKAATKLVGSAQLPRSIGTLGSAAEAAKIGTATGMIEQGVKKLRDADDYDGALSALEAAATFAALSLVGSGVKGVWAMLRPGEQARALKLLGLKAGASEDEIRHAASRIGFQYHPDKVAGKMDQFKKVMAARDTLLSDIGRNVIRRGRPPVPQGKGVAGLLPMGPEHEAIREATDAIQTTPEALPAGPDQALLPAGRRIITPPRVLEMPGDLAGASTEEAIETVRRVLITPEADPTEIQKVVDVVAERPEVAEGAAPTVQDSLTVAPEAPAGEGRQPWEMTKDEFDSLLSAPAREEFGPYMHRNLVLNAALEGKDIPATVRAEYPDLDDRVKEISADQERMAREQVEIQARQEAWEKTRQAERDEQESVARAAVIEAGRRVEAMSYKEPWELTLRQYTVGGRITNKMKAAHRDEVQQAVSEGKPVPRRVLEEYQSEPWADEALAKLEAETPPVRPSEPRETEGVPTVGREGVPQAGAEDGYATYSDRAVKVVGKDRKGLTVVREPSGRQHHVRDAELQPGTEAGYREGTKYESLRRREVSKAVKAIQEHPLYQTALEGIEAQQYTGTNVAGATIYVEPEYAGDIEAYAGEDRRGKLWRQITFDKGKGVPWDGLAQEAGLPDDFDGFMSWFKEAVESGGKGTLNRKALDAAVAMRDPELELLVVRHSMLVAGYTGPEINQEIDRVGKELALDYDLTGEDVAGIVQKVQIEGPYGQETSQPVQPGDSGAAPQETADTGIFGQTIARPATGKTQGELGLEFETAERPPIEIKPVLASEVAKLAGRYETPKDLYAGELLDKSDLFHHPENPLPEVQEAWDQATLGRRLPGSRYKGMVDIEALVKAAHAAQDWIFTFGGIKSESPELYERLMRAYGERNAGIEKAITIFDRLTGGVQMSKEMDRQLAYAFEDKRLATPKGYEGFLGAVKQLMQRIEDLSIAQGLIARPFQERMIEENNARLAKLKPGSPEAQQLIAENIKLANMRYLPHGSIAAAAMEAKLNRLKGVEREEFLKRISAMHKKREGRLLLSEYVEADVLEPKDISLRRLVLEALEGYYHRASVKSLTDFATEEGLILDETEELRQQGWHNASEIGVSSPELKGKLLHPMYARALAEMADMRRSTHSPLRRILGAVKIGQFLKPTIIWNYNAIQKFMNGIYLFNPVTEARLLAESVSDVLNQTAIYHRCNESNLFQFPYEVSKAAKEEQIAVYVRKHTEDISRLQKLLEATTGQSWDPKDLDLVKLITASHTAVGNATWFGDKVQRLQSYKVLRRMGYGHDDAVRIAGHSHGAYSLLSQKFKKAMSPLFFVYSFRLLMPMRIAQILAEPIVTPAAAFFREGAEGVKKIPRAEWRRWAQAWAAVVAMPVLVDEWLESKGFEKEGKHLGPLAWKWKKTVVYNEGKDDESHHEIILGLNTILNMPVKYWNRLTYYNPIEPKSRAHQAWSNFWKWEIHPLYRIFFWDLADNKRSFGTGPVYDQSASPPVQLAQMGAYIFGQSFKFWGGVLDAVGAGDMTDAEAERQKEIVEEALGSWDGKLLRTIGYAYVRMPLEERQAIMRDRLRSEHRRRVYEITRKYPPETHKAEYSRRMKTTEEWLHRCEKWIDEGFR